jgi:hypothetical protein
MYHMFAHEFALTTAVSPPATKVAPQGTTGSDGQVTAATALFYESWMTGWSLQSCRNLYFESNDYSHLQPGPREKLLSWLSAAVDLVDKWKVVDSSAEAHLKKMLDDVSQGKTAQTVNVDAFDRDVAEILGTIRAQVPYGYQTAAFASDSSRLAYPREIDIGHRTDTLTRLRGSLSKIRHVVPQGAFDVINNDIKKMIKKNKSPFGDPIGDDKPLSDQQRKHLTEVVQVWADLMLGTLAAKDALSKWGRTLLYLSVGGVGIVMFSIVGVVIGLVFLVVPILTGTSAAGLSLATMKDLISSISTLVTTLSAVGLSLSLLATKAWSGVKAFEPWAAVQLARWPRVRKRVYVE